MMRELLFTGKSIRGLLICGALAAFGASAFGSTVFLRPLPISGINAAGAARSNIGIDQGSNGGGPFILGDDIFLSATAANTITGITVFIVGNCLVANCNANAQTEVGSEFNSINLYGATYAGNGTPVTLRSSSYTATRVRYNGTTDYLSAVDGTTLLPIYQITFSGLNINVAANSFFLFAVQGVPTGNNIFALHGSNAALSGNTQNDVDNTVLGYQGNPFALTFGASSFANFANTADINVLVDVVPEPASIALSAIGLAGLMLAVRRRRQSTN